MVELATLEIKKWIGLRNLRLKLTVGNGLAVEQEDVNYGYSFLDRQWFHILRERILAKDPVLRGAGQGEWEWGNWREEIISFE